MRPAIWLLVAGALCWHLIWRMDGLGLFLMLCFIAATAFLESDPQGYIR